MSAELIDIVRTKVCVERLRHDQLVEIVYLLIKNAPAREIKEAFVTVMVECQDNGDEVGQDMATYIVEAFANYTYPHLGNLINPVGLVFDAVNTVRPILVARGHAEAAATLLQIQMTPLPTSLDKLAALRQAIQNMRPIMERVLTPSEISLLDNAVNEATRLMNGGRQ